MLQTQEMPAPLAEGYAAGIHPALEARASDTIDLLDAAILFQMPTEKLLLLETLWSCVPKFFW